MSIWSNIKFASYGNLAAGAVGKIGYNFHGGGNILSSVKFRSRPAGKDFIVWTAQRLAMKLARDAAASIIPGIKYDSMKKRLDKLKEEKANSVYTAIIKNGEATVGSGGTLNLGNDKKIVARDYLGRTVNEAMFIYYEGTKNITYTFKIPSSTTYEANKQNFIQSAAGVANSFKVTPGENGEDKVTTPMVVHIDLTPEITVQTGKNMIATTVLGLDYTRKELISRTDLSFSINGVITSDTPGVYPTEAVKRLVDIAQYKGIVNVQHYLFSQFGVTSVIIRDFSLGVQEFKNIQPYSLSCVAVKPDTVQLNNDTIGRVNDTISTTEDKWYEVLLNSKIGEIMADSAISTATSGISAGLDIENLTGGMV